MDLKQSNLTRFQNCRARLFRAIKAALEEDGICKSYEGSIEVIMEYPDYFEDENAKMVKPSCYVIRVHCYVVGPHRHHDFPGKTWGEAVNAFEKALDEWEC